jgi:uncharacterized OsmC-like protein
MSSQARSKSTVRRLQAPLRARYAERPEEAIVFKRVRAVNTPDSDLMHGSVVATAPEYDDVVWRYGTDRKLGGPHDAPNGGEILCAALAACMDNIVRMLADHLGIELADLELEVTGDVDVRGCMAIEPEVRPGFRWLAVDARLRPAGGTDERLVAALTAAAERLCVTLDTLRHGTPVELRWQTQTKTPNATRKEQVECHSSTSR